MKKIILVGALAIVASSSVFATTACTGTAGKASITASTNFIKNNFQTPCSANVFMHYDENASSAWVASASKKGACYQIGHTDAGVKQESSTCTPSNAQLTGADPAPDGKLATAAALGSS